MKQDFPKISEIQNTYLAYEYNGSTLLLSAKLRFVDEDTCYMDVSRTQVMDKPKDKTKAKLTIYSKKGIYKADVQIQSTLFSLNDVSYEVNVPKHWEITQMRASERKIAQANVIVKYADGYELQAETYDISVSGVSFYTKEVVTSLYKQLPCSIQISFSDFSIDGQGKFVKCDKGVKEYDGQYFYVYRFECNDTDIRDKFKKYINNSV